MNEVLGELAMRLTPRNLMTLNMKIILKKNKNFVNIDEDEEFVDVEDDDFEGKKLYENVDGNGVPCMNQKFQTLEDVEFFFRAYALKNEF